MKRKLCLMPAAFFVIATAQLSAASYDDNFFQRKSREYSAMAEAAFEEGDYDNAIEYAREAEEKARLSEEHIRRMLLRADAETEMSRARARMAWAREIKADVNFPDEYRTAGEHFDMGERSFDEEDFESAKRHALLAIDALSGIEEVGLLPALPATYEVRNWSAGNDCFWSIAAKDAVYADPFQWRKLYEANKHRLPDPDNPHVIWPGTILEIPSLRGEVREGRYDHSIDYGSVNDR